MESVFKVIIVGEPKVGKTSFLSMYCHRQWLGNYKPTTGADFAVKNIKLSDTENVRLHLWDIAGQDYARVMARTYYNGASGCIIMFDLTDHKTFEESRHWKRDVDNKVFLRNSQPIPCLLVANKDDLPNKVVSVTELEEFAVDNGFMGYICISVKHDRNIAEAMMQLVKKMLDYDHESRAMDQQELLESEHISKFGGGVRLSNDQNKAEGGGGSCCFASRAQAQT